MDERRAHPRLPFTGNVTVAFDEPPGTVTAYARDLSKGGLAIISRTPLPLRHAVVALPRRGGATLRIHARGAVQSH